jgi:hypothetical protein
VKRSAAALAAILVVAGAGAGVIVASRSNSSTATKVKKPPLTTALVTQQDLTIYDTTTATLGFTTSVTVSSPVAGTVTSLIATGTTVRAGTVVATVDGAPVVALIGDIPAYRDLSKGVTAGIDVRELETNLVMLGFDPKGAIKIDETYDSATAAAVTLWENSLGLTGNGKVTKGEIVFVPGELLVDTASVTVGASVNAGSPLVSGRQTARSFLVTATGAAHGPITKIVAPNTPITTGTVLFWQNGNPVVAIEGDAGTTPALTRNLSTASTRGVDIKLLESMLVAGKFAPNNDVVVDDTFDTATAKAVQFWWYTLGIPSDAAHLTVPAGSFVVVPGGLFAGSPLIADGSAPAGDSVVLSLTTAAREVTTSAPIGDATFAMGATIEVDFPDGTISQGTVVKVGTVATTSSNTPGATPAVPITLHVADIPKSVDTFVQIPVTLRAVSQQAKHAFVVPVSALVALAEGGYALEVVTDAGGNAVVVSAPPDTSAGATTTTLDPTTTPTRLIGVTTGIFANGFVSVTGKGLEAGLRVVVPS